MVICHCERVTSGLIQAAIERGAGSLEDVGTSCRAGTGCGSCHVTIERLLAAAERLVAAPAA